MLRRIINAIFLIGIAGVFGFVIQAADHNRGLVLRGSVVRQVRAVGKKDADWSLLHVLWVQMEFKNEGDQNVIIPFGILTTDARFFDGQSKGEFLERVRLPFSTSDIGSMELSSSNGTGRILAPGERYGMMLGIDLCVAKVGDPDISPPRCFNSFKVDNETAIEDLLKKESISIRFRTPDVSKKFPGRLEALAARWQKSGILPLNDQGEFSIESQPITNNTKFFPAEEVIDSSQE